MIILLRDIPETYLAAHIGKAGIKAAESSYRAWSTLASVEEWRIPQDIKASHPKASILKAGRVVFKIKGNDYRMVCKVNYSVLVIEIRWFCSHSEYDDIDAGTI